MKFKNMIALALIVAAADSAVAQFVPAFGDDQLPLNQACEVTALDGKVYLGKLKSALQMNGKLKLFSIALDDGTGKKKFGAEEVTLVKMKPSNLHKIAETLNASANVGRMKDIKNIIDCDWIYYETVTLGKKDKSYLMQRLNPGAANNKLKAYADPNAKQESSFGLNGMTLVGGKEKSYFLVGEDGNKAVLAEKGKYKKQMAEIYTGCASFFSDLNGDTDWGNFSKHVALYNHTCK
jgi:hypothetical protein